MDSVKLQKYFTDCGIMSRRAAEAEISAGKVKVNGAVAKLGDRIDPNLDTVEYNGHIVRQKAEERICVMLNKPRGYVTTMSDEKNRPTVAALVSNVGRRVYPIGRLDMDSDGLLLLTDDGELANKLTHPRHEIPKIYLVTVSGKVSTEQLHALSSPMNIDGYEILPVKTEIWEYSRKNNETILKMTLYEGRNRQIRKMCSLVELNITKLSRVAIGELTLSGVGVGKWRILNKDELDYLMSGKKMTNKG